MKRCAIGDNTLFQTGYVIVQFFCPTARRKRVVQITGTTVRGHFRFSIASRVMPELSILFLAACMFLGATLYTSVGHAGASA